MSIFTIHYAEVGKSRAICNHLQNMRNVIKSPQFVSSSTWDRRNLIGEIKEDDNQGQSKAKAMKDDVSKRLLDKEKATINPGGNLDLSILFIRLLGHQQLGCRQFDKVLLFTMTLSYPIPGLVVLFPTIVLSFPSSLNPSSYLSNLSASPLNIVRTLPQSCSASNIRVPLDGPSNLAVSDGEVSSMIAVGRGIQNYTCNSGAYVSIGALAK